MCGTDPGDGGLYLSYDADFGAEQTQAMKFFKIAHFPQQRRNNGINNNNKVTVSLPDWLPAGKAVMRWDWYVTLRVTFEKREACRPHRLRAHPHTFSAAQHRYATHNEPYVEFYSNCVDVDIVVRF